VGVCFACVKVGGILWLKTEVNAYYNLISLIPKLTEDATALIASRFVFQLDGAPVTRILVSLQA